MTVFTLPERDSNSKHFMQTLYAHYSRLIYATIRQYISKGHDREDVVQDVVESLCKHVDTLKALPKAAISSYIVYTAKNTALNFLRHQAIVERHTAEAEALDHLESTDIRGRMEQIQENKDRLHRVWHLLPEEDRELLYRKYVFGQSNEELADLFHCKKDSIRTRLMRARRKALALLEGDDCHDETGTVI